ncbi:MAG: peptidoglycan DD-metalloendopeptidase family protein [Alphaproteobacteria bacterium]|nr:peptidoglycan DD-metalloendopeptidase family protein [Alphaproteobacteria bacterium]
MLKNSVLSAFYPKHHDRPSPQPRAATRGGYAIVHGGRQFRLGPVAFWTMILLVILLGLWSAATATYFAFRDDVLTRLLARQAEMQYAYEDRIAELRARVDRAVSRQLLNQEQFDQKLEQVMRRQATLESHATALDAITDVTGSIQPAGRSSERGNPGQNSQPEPAISKPSPINDTAVYIAPPDREARLESRVPVMTAPQPNQFAKAQGVDNALQHLSTSLDTIARRQTAALNSIEDGVEARMRRMRGVVSDLGLDMAQLQAATPRAAAVGGPFVPVKVPPQADAFETHLYRISTARAEMERLTRTLAQVPYRKPVIGEVEFTSGFGVRTDPFLGRPAMHTGLDFRAAFGDLVRATANGVVTSATWSGGYGRMVEINHGNGLSTRYGHLSAISVRPGETVRIGQIIGEVGSTGRSTGPHLHYETRIDGEAVDPQKFLRAGLRLTSRQRL